MKRIAIKRVGLLLLSFLVAYVLLHLHPHPLFAYSLTQGPVVLHAREPFPPSAAELLREVDRRLARSPLYRADRPHDVFLCDSPALYAFFAPHHPNTGGETFVWLGNNIFLRPAHVAADRLVGASGREVPGNRTLTYFLTHELAHALTADFLGTWQYLKLERWQEDGYADYVAKAGDFDFPAMRTALEAGAAELDPDRSGLYLRYHLLVAYLLDVKGLSVGELLSGPRPAGPVETDVKHGELTVPDAGQPDAEAPEERPSHGNTGTCAISMNVALAQARQEAVKGATSGAAHCPARIMHGVVFERGTPAVIGEVHLNEQLTLSRQEAHEREVCSYNAIIPCPTR